jgi:uncharacterized protein YlxP (DUF503 family)
MVVGTLRLDLQLYSPSNLKEKRSIVKSLLGRCRERFPVSCAEIGAHDVWQRTELGFALVLNSAEADIDAWFEKIEAEILRSGVAEICDSSREILHYS